MAGAVRLVGVRLAPRATAGRVALHSCPPTRSSPPSSTDRPAPGDRTSRRACTCRAAQELAGRPARRPRRRAAHRAPARPARAQRRVRARRSRTALRDRSPLAPHESADDALAVDRRAGDEARGVVRARADDGRRRGRGHRCSATRATSIPGSPRGARTTVHGADHEYGVRRAIVDAVPDAVLRLPPQVAGAARRVPHVELRQPSRPLTAAVRLHA